MAPKFKRVTVEVQPGTNKDFDDTQNNALTWADTDKMEFYKGRMRTIPFWDTIGRDAGFENYWRAIFSYEDGDTKWAIYASNVGVFATNSSDGTLSTYYDITPLNGVPIAAANSLANDVLSYGATSISTTNGSTAIRFNGVTHNFLNAGKSLVIRVNIAGVTGTVNGIPAASINGTRTVTVISSTSFQVTAGAAATSTGTGGNVGITAGSNVIKMTATAHGLPTGAVAGIDVAGATAFGGFTLGQINDRQYAYVANSNTLWFAVSSPTTSTSALTTQGGAATTYQKTLTTNYADGSAVWSFGRFGNDLILCSGNNSTVYIWVGSNPAVLPTALTNAPTGNWIYVSNNAVHVLGANGVPNAIAVSDVGDATIWSVGPGTLAYSDTVENCGRFITQSPIGNDNVLFTGNAAFLFRYVGLPNIWEIEEIFTTDGVVGPKARTTINNTVFWVGASDVYSFDGNSITPLPSTVKKWMYAGDAGGISPEINQWCFIRPVPQSNQFWVHLDREYYVIFDYIEGHTTTGIMRRSAAEEPGGVFDNPLMTSPAGTCDYYYNSYDLGTSYKHDMPLTEFIFEYVGEDSTNLYATATTNWAMIGEGDNLMEIMEIQPDIGFPFSSTGQVRIYIQVKDDMNVSDYIQYGPYLVQSVDGLRGRLLDTTLSPTQPRIMGRMRRYIIQQDHYDPLVSWSSDCGPFWMGKYQESIQMGPPR